MCIELKAYIEVQLNMLTIEFLVLIPMVRYTHEFDDCDFIIDVQKSSELSSDFERATSLIAVNSRGKFSEHEVANSQFIHITLRK